jgi:hypothetical protein
MWMRVFILVIASSTVIELTDRRIVESFFDVFSLFTFFVFILTTIEPSAITPIGLILLKVGAFLQME